MARQKINVNRNLLQECISEADAESPATRAALWGKVSQLYNDRKRGTDRAITPVLAHLRATEWKIVIVTPPGKRGSSGARSSFSASDSILFAITGWESHEVKIGRHVGKATRSRMVIACDKYNWILGKQSKGSESIQQSKFFPGFRLLLPEVKQYTSIDVAQLVADELQKRLEGDPVELKGDLGNKGKQIDHHFKVNHCVHDHVRRRIFDDDYQA